jgi:hypothetical protein
MPDGGPHFLGGVQVIPGANVSAAWCLGISIARYVVACA